MLHYSVPSYKLVSVEMFWFYWGSYLSDVRLELISLIAKYINMRPAQSSADKLNDTHTEH